MYYNKVHYALFEQMLFVSNIYWSIGWIQIPFLEIKYFLFIFNIKNIKK